MQKEIKEEECDYSFKIALVGECDVGKTCIWQNYLKGMIPKKTVPTIGVEFETKFVTLSDGSRIKAQIWDTAGQERYRSLTNSHFRKVVGALAIFDLTNKTSLEKLQLWIQELKHHGDGDIQIIIVGNKLDLVQKNPSCRQVSEDDIKQFVKQNKWKVFEISAQVPENVNQCFECLFIDLCKQKTGFRGGEQSQLKLMKQSANLNEGKCKC
uniref:Rab_C49 protein n=1 Tax=Paramecium tetraurelia TaxID=5888 RepID=Q3SD74_PARTE|nr:rab_C49 [Paramecium tetraurelia]